MDEITIETAETEDSEALAALWVDLAAGQREYGSHLFPKENRQQIRESIVRHVVDGALLVARDSDGIVGFVMFTVESGGYDQDTSRGIVENLYVVPSYRGEGLGERLLSAAERRLETRGVDAVALEVMATNDDAREFYRRQGYDQHRIELEKPTESDTHSKGDE